MHKKYDAALIHVYGYEKRTDNNPVRLSMRSMLVLEAARELSESGQVENFVFASRPALGSKEPWSTATANELIRMTNIKKDHVFTNITAPPTTNQELKFLRETAQKQNWSKVLSIGCDLHKRTVETLASRFFNNGIHFDFKSCEEILQAVPSASNQQRYKRMIDSLHHSEGEKKFAKYESGIMNKFKLHFPFGPEILDVVARFYRPRID